jgi:hypothetical protein
MSASLTPHETYYRYHREAGQVDETKTPIKHVLFVGPDRCEVIVRDLRATGEGTGWRISRRGGDAGTWEGPTFETDLEALAYLGQS